MEPNSPQNPGLFSSIARAIGMGEKQQQQQAQQQQNPQQNQNQQAQQKQGENGNAQTFNQGDGQQKETAPQSIEEMFPDLWKNDPNANKAPPKLFDTDLKAFNEAVGKMDFTGNLDPELTQKALGGDMAALKQLLNSGSRSAFEKAMVGSSNLMESAFTKKEGEFNELMTKRFKDLSTESALGQANPMFKNPAVKPLVDSIASQLKQRFPEATPEDISAKAQQYFLKVAKDITEQTQKQEQTQQQNNSSSTSSPFETKDGGFDWDKYAATDDAGNTQQ